jgi:hypothetical protein
MRAMRASGRRGSFESYGSGSGLSRRNRCAAPGAASPTAR